MTRSKGSFGELLRSARIRNAYSQDELAKRLKVSQGTISNWEKDKSCPDKEQLDQLSKLLGIKERKSEKSNGVDIQIGPSPLGAWLNRTRVSQAPRGEGPIWISTPLLFSDFRSLIPSNFDS